jgi:hypothetical protein
MISFSVFTPFTILSSTKISFTLVFNIILTFKLFNFFSKHFKTSKDLSVTGKILFPLSSFTSNPSSFNSFIIS